MWQSDQKGVVGRTNTCEGTEVWSGQEVHNTFFWVAELNIISWSSLKKTRLGLIIGFTSTFVCRNTWHKVIQHLHSLADVFVLDFWMEMLHNPGPELVPCYLSNCQPSKGRTLQVGPASFPAGQVSAGIYHSFCRDLSFPLQAQGI